MSVYGGKCLQHEAQSKHHEAEVANQRMGFRGSSQTTGVGSSTREERTPNARKRVINTNRGLRDKNPRDGLSNLSSQALTKGQLASKNWRF